MDGFAGLFFSVALIGSLAGVSSQIIGCWDCSHGWVTPALCNVTAIPSFCPGNGQFICHITVKNEQGGIGIRKGCWNVNACRNNAANNAPGCSRGFIPAGKKCTYCCDHGDLCNWDRIDYQPDDDEDSGTGTLEAGLAPLTVSTVAVIASASRFV